MLLTYNIFLFFFSTFIFLWCFPIKDVSPGGDYDCTLVYLCTSGQSFPRLYQVILAGIIAAIFMIGTANQQSTELETTGTWNRSRFSLYL